eukprot:6488273-Amphidinium_carterae.1
MTKCQWSGEQIYEGVKARGERTFDPVVARIFARNTVLAATAKAFAHIPNGIPDYWRKVLDTHVMYHGTKETCIQNIDYAGLKESEKGMLGKGLYATHSMEKAKNYMGAEGGCMYKVEFTSGNVKVTDLKDTSWSDE